MLKIEGIFLKNILIITYLSYENAKIIINFTYLFQMLKIMDVSVVSAWNLNLNLLRISQIKEAECVFLVPIITDILHFLRNVLKDIHGLLR